MACRTARSGFSLIESAVVLSLLTAAAGLLLPAVARVRETAARAGCADHLKTIGEAMAAYETAHGRFPHTLGVGDSRASGHGWMPLLLPHLGRDDLARRYRFDADWHDPVNATAGKTVVPLFVCPSAPSDTRQLTTAAYGRDLWPYPEAATTDYLGVSGILVTLRGTPWVPPGVEPLGCGAIGRNRGYERTEFTDGLAYTAGVSEDAGRPFIWRVGKRSDTDHTPTILPERPNLSGAWAAHNVTGYRSFTADGLVQPGECPVNCSNWIGGLYSFHPGGVNTLYMDGAVRFVPRATDVSVVYATMTRAGGELLTADDF